MRLSEHTHGGYLERNDGWQCKRRRVPRRRQTMGMFFYFFFINNSTGFALRRRERESARTRACECAAERESKSVSMALCFCVFSFTDNVTDNQNVCGETNGEERRERESERGDACAACTSARRTTTMNRCTAYARTTRGITKLLLLLNAVRPLFEVVRECVVCVWEIESGEWFAALFHFAACMRRCVAWAYISASCEAELYARRVNDCKRIARGD